MAKIYTRTGDGGNTHLSNGKRIKKSHPQVMALGSIDELNATIGLLCSELSSNDHEIIHHILNKVQHQLFGLGAEISGAQEQFITNKHIQYLETSIDKLSEQLQPLKNFILPAGSKSVALSHFARTVCRRAEIQVLNINTASSIDKNWNIYLNRLSDALFVIARTLGKNDHEIIWDPNLDLDK